jgi:hypothetical protein
MPFFKSTYNILKKYDEDEVHNPNWMDSDKLITPKKGKWDYSRELKIEDIDVWEVLYEASGGLGVYAAWDPSAEFYMLTTGLDFKNEVRWIDGIPYQDRIIETFYGQGAQDELLKRCVELNIVLQIHNTWVEPEEMWLFSPRPPEDKKIIVI